MQDGLFLDIGDGFYMYEFRVPTERSGRRAGRIEKNGVELSAFAILQIVRAVGADGLRRRELQARHIVTQFFQTGFGNVQRNDFGAAVDELGGFAAGSGAHVKNFQAADIAEAFDRQSRRRVLNPPGAAFVAFDFGNAAVVAQTDGTRRQQQARRASAPNRPDRS